LFTTKPVHKPVLTMVMCAVVRLRALMARHSARLITNPPIVRTCGSPNPNFEKMSTPTPTPESGVRFLGVRFSGVRESLIVLNGIYF
jgi:hypothetical protein